MSYSNRENRIDKPLAALGQDILTGLAKQFPVCMSSDEFHFFPQYRLERPKWSQWDDFSESGRATILEQIGKWQHQLQQWHLLQGTPQTAVDIEILLKVLSTVQEQIELVRPHQFQPTFYLTIASMGLGEALDTSHEAFGQRLEAMPYFLDTAKKKLKHIPGLYKELGIAMTGKIKRWLDGLQLTEKQHHAVGKSLDEFGGHLMALKTMDDFRLPGNVYGRIAEHHLGCGMGLEEIGWHLDQEIEEAEYLLAQSAARIEAGKPWESVWKGLPSPSIGANELVSSYSSIIGRLKSHCIEQGFFDPEMVADGGVAVQAIPEHLQPIRANAAYSMPAGHPPKGGTFYVMPAVRQRIPRGMMLLAAHETYPGHHLLDTLRWQLENPLRRSMEFPIFYEGWACFAEEILFDTDLFSGPADRLLLAKRRYWRAQRGLADLNIHSGNNRLEEAADALCRKGLATREQALAMVQRYALKPGYQLAYTIGRRKFRQLYTAYLGRGKTPAQFVRNVLAEGEVGFERLAERLLY